MVFVVGGLSTFAVGRLFGLAELFIMGAALITCVIVASTFGQHSTPKY